MTKFNVININDKELWEEIADNTVEIYDKWQYVSAYYQNGEGIPHLAYLEGKEGIAYYVYLKRDIRKIVNFQDSNIGNLYDIISPYGYGGVKIKGKITEEEKKEFFSKFEQYCIENNIVCDFVRLNPLEDNYKNYNCSNYTVEKISKTVYIKLESEEQIWNDLKHLLMNYLIIK